MTGGTIAIVGVGVVAVGAGVYFLTRKPSAPIAGGPAPVFQAGTGATRPAQAPASVFSDSHVDRKNAIAPYVLGRFGVPTGAANTIAGIAGKFDVSGYAERKLEKVPYVGTAIAMPTKIASSVFHGITSLF